MTKVKNTQQLYWLFQFTGWGTFTLLNLLFTYLNHQEVSIPDIAYCFFIFVLGIALSNFIRWVFKRFNWLNQNITLILHKQAILAIGVACINILVLYFLTSFCRQTTRQSLDLVNFIRLSASFGSVYFVWGILYFTIYFFRNFKKEEIINLKNQAQMTEIHLNKLKSQLNPHFMFNAMNVLRALIDEDKNKAKEGITQLSNILRQTLNINQQKLISLQDELQLVNDYLSLEKLRFEERLNYKIDISPEFLNYQIPPMLLQTLVENAIKHGISKLIKGGDVKVEALESSNGLSITILNSGQYHPENTESGFGLKNSQERLDFIFNGLAKLDIQNTNSEQVITSLFLPKNFTL